MTCAKELNCSLILSHSSRKNTILGIIKVIQIIATKCFNRLNGPFREVNGFCIVLSRRKTRKATCQMLEFSRISAGTNGKSNLQSENIVIPLLSENIKVF